GVTTAVARIDGDLGRKVAASNGRGHAGDITDLLSQVARHGVYAFGQILPRAGDALDDRLTAEFPFRADFARHARHFAGERIELIDHGVHDAGGAEELALQATAVHLERHLL